MRHLNFFGRPVSALPIVLAVSAVSMVSLLTPSISTHQTSPSERYIVQGASSAAARRAVEQVSGQVLSEVNLIRAVGARLSKAQASLLEQAQLVVTPDFKIGIHTDAKIRTKEVTAAHSQWIEAPQVHAAGLDGSGVTVAFVDTGLWKKAAEAMNLVGWVDVVGDEFVAISGKDATKLAEDDNGHGTHLTALAGSRTVTSSGLYEGVAPGASFVSVRAFDATGSGTYLDVIEGLDWIVQNKDALGIRVANLSFGAALQSFYWEDPVNQAVMATWQAGIVVVTSAGNQGPAPMTIGVPGNNPYAITVGAASDNRTVTDTSDDFVTSFSSTGPTYESFVKPEIIAPGDYVVAMMDPDSVISQTYGDGGKYFAMSGTSQSAAIVSGVVALMLQGDPGLSPDDVKCRLMLSARAAGSNADAEIYSVFQQGAGLVNAAQAVYSTATGCANQNLDVAADLSGEAHFAGPAAQDDEGLFYVISNDERGARLEGEGYTWGGRYSFSQGYVWGGRSLFASGYPWGKSNVWSNGYVWGDRPLSYSDAQTQGYPWGKTSINGYPWGKTTIQGYPWGKSPAHLSHLEGEQAESPRQP